MTENLKDILSLNLDELTEQTELMNLPKFRAKQIFEWLHFRKVSDFSEMTNISVQTQSALSKCFCIISLKIQKTLVSNIDNTVKYLYKLPDGNTIETVFMSHNHGNSLCMSTQAGCRMNCAFCASGKAGLVRNLEPSEILSQLYTTQRTGPKIGNKIDSLVLMGVGEPLDNFANVVKFLEILRSGAGMSLRNVSLSTCGLTDKIDALARLKLPLTLSVSLHASNDADRSAIMPINKKFPLRDLLLSCADYFKVTGRRISYEYALIGGVNDGETNARELVGLMKGLPYGSYHVNLIPINPVKETGFKKSANMKPFSDYLRKNGVNATVRRTLGADIDAACGQLRLNKGK